MPSVAAAQEVTPESWTLISCLTSLSALQEKSQACGAGGRGQWARVGRREQPEGDG